MDSELYALGEQVGAALKNTKLVLTTAESCTGGWIGEVVTMIAGSSAWYDRGFITYTNAAKQQMLGVSGATLAQHGAVSEAVVREMVSGALQHSAAQVALAVSGIAGPDGGTSDKPVGTVWFAWGIKQGETQALRYQLSGGRSDVRTKAVKLALQGVLDLLSQHTEQA